MTKELVDRLSNHSLLGYYNDSLKMLCVHFFGGGKADVMAYLRPNLTWDLREVVEEYSELFDDHEKVLVWHKSLGTFEAGSKFDEFIRGMLTKSLEADNYVDKERIQSILTNGYT